tara:strand:+ start:5422 stop:6396 length:975 start_codon:yes stop_codon:yes gene_type:complete
MKNLVAIIAGDPNSINSEIIGKVWKKKSSFKNLNIFIIGNYNLIKNQLKILKIKVKLKRITNIKKQNFRNQLLILDVPLKFKKPFYVPKKIKAKYVINSLNLGIKMVQTKKILGFINCPINKKQIFGNKNFGITEFLARKLNVLGKEVMLIYNRELSVAPITTHIKLKKVPGNISKKKIIEKLLTINKFYLKNFKIKPKIGVLGLNPHNDELKRNSEEKKIIIPAIKNLKSRKISVHGPLSPDTAFLDFKKKSFHVLVGMYHDQVLSPFKALFKFEAINITLGLPFVRISPDHGTGNDIVGKSLANPTSLLESIKFFKNKNVKT